jgi:hypothetical protein
MAPRIAEVMGLVDQHDVGEFGDTAESLREVALAAKVRMAEDREVAEVRVPTGAADGRPRGGLRGGGGGWMWARGSGGRDGRRQDGVRGLEHEEPGRAAIG